VDGDKIWGAQRIHPWSAFFPSLYNKVSIDGTNIFLYVDDTSIIVTNPDYSGYKVTMNEIFHEVSKWFKINLLSLNQKKLITYKKRLTKMI
jgi:hypothetical protein